MRIKYYALFFILLLLYLSLTSCKEERLARMNVKKCKSLKLGMKRAEVIRIMGEPQSSTISKIKIRGRIEEYLTFKSPFGSAIMVGCAIDFETKKVVRIECEDGYLIMSDCDESGEIK